ncbi:Crp/Fnr family transcriptional regulator [Brevibacillus humidisoli]|uniref:Crp/Fnr family transcriptional regulator n=1 Tax=Brevibacillus humidisoli TaxID=2895522 RepID=UPI001E5782C6|nr:Crp/Fnr family transcriptional regulator [Brevibacillus humidisoli]UFJ41763.1 Crp/Fnr family transcriptional regulator [Brevibacillus humidisoli]
MIHSDLKTTIENTFCFSEKVFSKLKEIMSEKLFPAGTHLFSEGDPADKLYYLSQGKVRITKAVDDGKSLIVYLYHEGDMFGQIDPFATSTHYFGAEIIADATVGIVQQRELEALLRQHGDLSVEFVKWMGLMHRLTQTKLRDLMLFGKTGTLCSLLLRLGNTYGVEKESQILLSQRFTNTELANMIGTTRESVNRSLASLKKAGAVSYEDGRIVILDPPYLRRISHWQNGPREICRI